MRLILKRYLKNIEFINFFYISLISFLLNFFKLFLIKTEKKIIFSSFSGRSFNDSPRRLFDLIKQDPSFNEYRIIWAFEDLTKFNKGSFDTVKIDSISYFYHILTASIWITNVNIDRGLRIKPSEVLYVNTWHGTPLKKVGNDVNARSDFNWNNVDIATVTGDYEKNIFTNAFKLDEKRTKIIKGNPRHDKIIATDKKIDKIFLNTFNPQRKKIILYAPTWRENQNFNFRDLINIEEWESSLKETHVIWVREHIISTVENPLPFEGENNFLFNVSSVPDVFEILPYVDILISDYSGMFFDFSHYNKPMICFAHDYEDYILKRGLYCDLKKTFRNRFCKDSKELLAKVLELSEIESCQFTKNFKNEFLYEIDNAGEKVILELKKKLQIES